MQEVFCFFQTGVNVSKVAVLKTITPVLETITPVFEDKEAYN